MSTGKTTYLGLHRWEPDDDFLRAEFNENSDKLDAEFQTMQKELDGEFTALRSELSSGISSARSELGAQISAVQTAVDGKAAASHTHDYAASSHNHAAGNITSGTLPVARGGTGNTSVDTTPTSGSTKMVTSGGVYTALSGKAASSHNHAAGSITSGTLPVARGGTGATTAAAALTALGGLRVVGSGTYVGDASGTPPTLTFTAPPKLLIVNACYTGDLNGQKAEFGFWINASGAKLPNIMIPNLAGNFQTLDVTVSGSTVTFGNGYYMNGDGKTYAYIGIG